MAPAGEDAEHGQKVVPPGRLAEDIAIGGHNDGVGAHHHDPWIAPDGARNLASDGAGLAECEPQHKIAGRLSRAARFVDVRWRDAKVEPRLPHQLSPPGGRGGKHDVGIHRTGNRLLKAASPSATSGNRSAVTPGAARNQNDGVVPSASTRATSRTRAASSNTTKAMPARCSAV